MNKDLKDIKFEELKESPSFILGCYIFAALVVVGIIAFSIYSIIGIKADLVTTRQSYQTHLQEIATLEELIAQRLRNNSQHTRKFFQIAWAIYIFTLKVQNNFAKILVLKLLLFRTL